MSKMSIPLLGALALLVVSGLAASTASAAGPYWHVGGSRFEKGATGLNSKAKARSCFRYLPQVFHSNAGTVF
jgi:hypothetical protein